MAPPRSDPVTQRVETVEEDVAAVKTTLFELQQTMQRQYTEQMALLNQRFTEMAAENSQLHSSIREVRETMAIPNSANGPTPTGSPNTSGGGAGAQNNGSNWRFRKLDMPLFDGSNPDGWIIRAERYFTFYRLGESEKLEAAVVAIEGDALLWYQWEHRRRPINQWEEMKMMLLRQFRPTNAGSLHEQWLAVAQVGTVIDYQRRFIELAAPLSNIPDEIALGQFINGLKPELRAELRVLGPHNLDHAMDLAIKVKDKLKSNIGRRYEPRTGTQVIVPSGGGSTYSKTSPFQSAQYLLRLDRLLYLRSTHEPCLFR